VTTTRSPQGTGDIANMSVNVENVNTADITLNRIALASSSWTLTGPALFLKGEYEIISPVGQSC